jgi:hypothetical protein
MNMPVVHCTKHAGVFEKTYQEMDDDGSQILVKQYWRAECCGFEVDIMMSLPKEDKTD